MQNRKSSSSPVHPKASAPDWSGVPRRGYRVVANSRSIKPSDDPDILAVAGDIADPETAAAHRREALERFGRIDTLVNNAGVFIAKPFTSTPTRTSPRNLAINVGGFFHITQAGAARNAEAGLRSRRQHHDQPGRSANSRRAVGARRR